MSTVPEQQDEVEFFLRASKVLSSTLDDEEILTRIVELTTEAVQAEAGSLLLYEAERDGLVFHVALGEKSSRIRQMVLPLNRGVSGRVFKTGRPAVVNDVTLDPDFTGDIDRETGYRTRSLLCVPLVLRTRTTGVLEAVNKRDGRAFDDSDVRLMTWLADLTAIALENARLYRSAKQEQREKQSLLEVAKRINAQLDLDKVLEMIADSMHEVMEYDALAIYLLDPDTGELPHLIARGTEEGSESQLRLKLGQGIVGWCIRNGESAVVGDVRRDARYFNSRDRTRSEIVTPLLIGGRWRGAINLESDRLNAWDSHQLELLKAFAGQVSVTIEKALLYHESIEKKKLEQELSVAHRIQQTFLPRSQPQAPGLDIAGRNIPSELVGGDYYDFIPIVDTQLGIVISDVSGKGIPAALIMASFRASLWAEIRNNYAIRTIMAKVGRLMRESMEPNHFVTALYGVIDLTNRIFTYANAGHNPPVLIRADRGVKLLKEGGIPICTIEQAAYHEKRLQLRPGDLLVLYTDGVTEAFSEAGHEFGIERLIATLLASYEKTATEIIEATVAEVVTFTGERGYSDDLTLVVIKVL